MRRRLNFTDLFFGLHSDEVPFTGEVPFEVGEGLLLVVLESMPLFVAQRSFHEVDGVLNVVRTQ